MRIAVFLSLVLVAAAASKLTPVHPNENLIDGGLTKGSRIVGGEATTIAEFPHQVSLIYNTGHSCGAIILNSTTVISAAHCTQNQASRYSIRAGSTERTSGGQTRSVRSIRNHPRYDDGTGTFSNDISLITLRDPLDLTDENVAKIDLPPASETFAGLNCYLTGWGRLSGGGSLPSKLQKVEMTIISYNNCKNIMSSISSTINVLDSHVCVDSTYVRSACNGDSGGPITCTKDNKKYVVGAASWVITGCSGAYPSVYTRISSFLDFIQY